MSGVSAGWVAENPVTGERFVQAYLRPFSPADIERGQVFEFKLNHVVEVDDPMELVRMRWIDLRREERK